ncbi:MAG: pyroglutamyl-peptidase I [Hyphomicrobiaceae bacterium]|nr:pyroglutamyl-peptidase I [Hyphomicrobiaceae bacterium]
MPASRPTILLTGFGPFPGIPENLTSRLVPEVAQRAIRRFRGHAVVSEIFPTEWTRAPQRLDELYQQHSPKLVLHFGVSERATGFQIETTAFNRCLSLTDAAGCLPSALEIDPAGSASMSTRLPAEDIVARLRSLNLPASLSPDAGSYLCNSIFYRTLHHAAALPRAAVAGFVHIPAKLDDSAGVQADAARPFDWNAALLGSLEIIRVCLGLAPRTHGRSASGKV